MFSALTSRKRSGNNADSPPPKYSPLHTHSPIHKFRAKTSSAKLQEPSNPDYLTQKHKLDHLSAFLTAALQVVSDSLDAWLEVSKQQSNFAAMLDQAGLPNGLAKNRCLHAARSTARCAAEIKAYAVNATIVPNALEQLQRFHKHIEALQERYNDVRRMKKDLDASAQKLRSSHTRIGVGGNDALAKAEAQFNRGRLRYESVVKRMADRMADANRRTPEVVKTVHYVFWLLQDKACERLIGGTELEMKTASAAEPALFYITFCQGLKSPTTIFQSLERRSSSRRRKRRSLFSSPTDAQE